MSRRWVWLGGGAAAILTVAVGIAINQVLNNKGWSWPWFAAAVTLAVATGVVDRRMAAAEQPRAALRRDLVDAKGHPLLISEVTPRQLGVHPSRFGPQGDSPYIARDVDEALSNAMREGDRRLVLVQGPRLAGTTSTLAQAAQTHLVGHRILAFVDDPRLTVAQMVAGGRRWAADGPGAVLWLDDLTPAQLGQLDRELLDELPTGMWILATVHDKYLKGFRVPEHVRAALEERAAIIRLGIISGRERNALRSENAYTALRPVLDTGDNLLMGRLMVVLDQIQNILALGRTEESTDQVALLRVITDWYRIAMPTLLTRRVLKDQYTVYRREIAGHDRLNASTTRFERILTWAMAKPSREHPQLVDLEEIGRRTQYVPHPLLAVVAEDTGQEGSWPVASAAWAYADRRLKGDQRRDIGYTALDRGAYPQACRLLRHDDTEIQPAALHQVAQWLEHTGDFDAARRWYTKVIAGDDRKWSPHVMIDLGNLEAEQGNPAQARRWFEEAIASGHADEAPRAMVAFGLLEAEQGNPAQAHRLFEQAIASGNSDAAPRAMNNLGNLEKQQGNLDQARHWWEQAIASGHPEVVPEAMINLGNLEAEQGNFAQARRRWEQAIASGHPDTAPRAMNDLAGLEIEQGNFARARRLLEQAIATGHPDAAPIAIYHRGILEHQQGNLDQARHWWEQAIATGYPDTAPRAMNDLAGLEAEQGNFAQARRQWEQAIATGHPDAAPRAMANLAILESVQGNLDQARSRWEQAIATGHPDIAPDAMINLGNLEAEQGNFSRARSRWEQAIASGHPEMAVQARRNLLDLERREGDRRRAEQFGRYGWQAYADPELMQRNSAGLEDDQPSEDDDDGSPQ